MFAMMDDERSLRACLVLRSSTHNGKATAEWPGRRCCKAPAGHALDGREGRTGVRTVCGSGWELESFILNLTYNSSKFINSRFKILYKFK